MRNKTPETFYKYLKRNVKADSEWHRAAANPETHDPVCTSTQCPYRAASSSIVGTRLAADSALSVCPHIKLPPLIQTGALEFLCVTSHTEQVSKTRKTDFVSSHWIFQSDTSQWSPGSIMSLTLVLP